MQPSQSDIQREFEALRDIRRRSTTQGGPGALILDPDLPNQPSTSTSPSSVQKGYWTSLPSSSNNDSTSTEGSSDSSHSSNGQSIDDPLHLFWVPAHLHPEIAPGEFRAFLKEHARAPSDGSTPSLSRSSSSSSRLGRKSSMLSRQYKPRENDGVEEEHVVPIQRRKSILYAQDGPQLSISDLQKLEELAEEAAKSDDPSTLRSVLRRSLSLNVPPSFLSQDNLPDDADIPIIVPPPGQILRRTARTKIRKPGLAGDGGGHRFANTRRRHDRDRANTVDSIVSDVSSDHGSEEQKRPQAFTVEEDEDELSAQRRNTYTEESSIYDSYAVDVDGADKSNIVETTPLQEPFIDEVVISHEVPIVTDTKVLVEEPIEEPLVTTPAPLLHHPQPQRQLSVPQAPILARTPSPEVPPVPPIPETLRQADAQTPEPQSFLSTSPSPDKRKKEEKKSSLLGKWGGEKKTKKGGKEDKREKEKEKEKESGFFGSLFGTGKKKQDDHGSSNFSHGGAGPAAAAALLGASKSSKGYQPSPSPQLANMYARYPIHVERAVYRLSHIKLANPRRPLYEQVLISNLMFWYLGVINKTQQSAAQAQPQNANQSQPMQQPGANNAPASHVESPFQHPNANIESAHAYSEHHQGLNMQEQMEHGEADHERERARRPSLTKTPPTGTPAASNRRAEMPVKGPQFVQQHQAMEHEYGPGIGTPNALGAQIVRTASAPPQTTPSPPIHNQPVHNNVNAHNRPHSPPVKQTNVGINHNQSHYNYNHPHQPNAQFHAIPGHQDGQVPRYMQQHYPHVQTQQPVEWMVPTAGQHYPHNQPVQYQGAPQAQAHDHITQYQHSRPPRSVPPNNYHLPDGVTLGAGGKSPQRSLSANAVPPGFPHDRAGAMLKKKPPSASAIAPGRNHVGDHSNSDEDVPLAVWQQQRRK